MGFCAVSTPGFSHIQLIIQKSMSTTPTLAVICSVSFDRVIIATIRDKGLCPCPRCNLPKTSFNRLGFQPDFMARLTCACSYLRDKVCAAIHAIYKLGNPIKGTVVEKLLKDWSLVPTLVRRSLHFVSPCA